jgi:hypothetical protein
MLDDEQLVATLTRMSEEAAETARRCEEVAGARTGRKTAILDKARETTSEAKEMMQTYLGEDAEGLDGLEFLSMAEAGEVCHVEILGAMARTAGDDDVIQLVEWALPIQERHLATVREGGVTVAAEEDPEEPA